MNDAHDVPQGSPWRQPLGPLLFRLLGSAEDVRDIGLTLQEALEQVATPLGGNLWDLDGTVVEASASDGLWWFRPTGAHRDVEERYYGLRCARCGSHVQHPVTLVGEGYVLGPFHPSCASEEEVEILQRIATGTRQEDVTPTVEGP